MGTKATAVFLCVAAIVSVVLMSSSAVADVPQRMNYQVMLTDDSNQPLADQAVTLTFEIYASYTGGSALWTEGHNTTTNSIGVVSAVLGGTTSLSVVDFSIPLWLEIDVDGEVLSPRRELVATPYALCTVDIEDVGHFAGTGIVEDGANRLKLTTAYETGSVYDGRFVNEGDMPTVVSSVDGVTNDGGDIDLIAGSNITITPDDGANTITISAVGGGGGDITAVYADNGLTGTATSGDAHLNIGAGNGINVTADAVSVNYGMGLRMDGTELEVHAQEIAGDGLTYDGTHTLEVNVGTGIEISSDAVQLDNSYNWTVSGDNMYSAVPGKVGIGDATPYAKLDVQDDTTTGTALYVYNGSFIGGMVGIFNWDHQLVTLAGNAPVAGGDVLEIVVNGSASTTAQFISCDIQEMMAFDDTKFWVNVDGEVYADGSFHMKGAGLAELVEVTSGSRSVTPGDVVVIDPSAHSSIVRSDKARSSLVAGIYSTDPGVCASKREWDNRTISSMADDFNEIPLAVVGIVPCKVSAENGPIHPGDLLVTSDTPGHAMRDDNPSVGTVIGKAMESLEFGTGEIKVLVTLQ